MAPLSPPGLHPRRLDGLDAVLLACIPLSLVPGVRSVTVIPALWLVPGWFLARRNLGIEGVALSVLAPAISLALTTVITLPAAVVAGRPTSVGLLASIAVFASACLVAPMRRLRVPEIPPPPSAYLAVLAAFTSLRLAAAVRAIEPDLSTPDGAYFVGMVRGLAAAFPPVCFELAPHRLLQPWGYWFLYAATHVVSGWSISQTLGLASAVLGVAFAFALYFFAYIVTRDRLAASITLPLALGGGGLGWLVRALVDQRVALDPLGWGGIVSPAENVWDGFYDLPALVLIALVLAFATFAVTERSVSSAVLALVGAAFLPLLHPTYSAVLTLAGFAALLFELGRRRVTWPWLAALAVTPLPFYVLYVRIYAGTLPAHAPFFTDAITPRYWVDRSADRMLALFAWGGAWILLALGSVFRRARPDAPPRSFVIALFGVSLALGVFTDNVAHNTHWTRDPLAVALVVLSASACARLLRTNRGIGVLVAGFLAALGVLSGHWERRLPERFNEIVRPVSSASPSQRDLAAWLRASTADDARVAVPANDSEVIDAVEGLAERPLLIGHDFHLVLTTPAVTLRDAEAANAAIVRDPRAAEIAREGVSYVVLSRLRQVDALRAWQALSPPAFENERFAVFRAAPRAR